MRKSKITVAMGTIALLGVLSPAFAQKDATATLVMPSGIDPARLTFTQEGFLYTNADGQGPGDLGGAPITGSMLLTSAFGGGGGLELHSQIPGQYPFTAPTVEVDLFTTYTGILEANSNPGTFAYAAWGVQPLSSVPAGYAQGFRFFMQPDSADMDVEAFYGVLSATLENPTDPTGFANASFGFAGFTTPQADTPEPGVSALLVGMGISGALLARKRRRK